ncbi:MAG: flagellar biosynthesis anti-sigma factor FlgM [Treponema sp.]|jgi:negative regulator of flagellin synthesis FlgM|nr:flagellar biosynthesis anti-sigma factor FlgM [Treponema sp.]
MINTIGSISSVTPILLDGKINASSQSNRFTSTDSINLSSEGLKKSEMYRINGIIDATPDVRLDVVERINERINDPAYINDEVLDAVADKLMKVFGFFDDSK